MAAQKDVDEPVSEETPSAPEADAANDHNEASTADEATASADEAVVEDAQSEDAVPDKHHDEVVDADPDDPLGFGDERMPETADAESELADLDVEQLRERVAQAEAKAEDTFNRLLRLQAEMENQRKRAQKDVEKARKFALDGMSNDLLPVKDSLEMGIAAAQSDDADLNKIIEGSDLTLKMLSQAFEKYNIVEINPAGEKFDPEFHQAMSMQEVEGQETNTVVNVLQKGYTLNDRLIRPALVLVAK